LSGAARGRLSLRLGVAIALGYAVMAALYVRVGPVPRPLFDGFAPPPPYRWVHPPKEFAAGNQPPKPSTIDVDLGPTGSAVASGSSEDGQVIISFGAGVFPAHSSDTKVVVRVTPVDPATLGAPPPGLLADGNAYRLEFAYQPSNQAIAAPDRPGDVFLIVPEPAQSLDFSPDGQAWQALPPRPTADSTQVGGSLSSAGYLLAVAPPVAGSTTGARSSDRGGILRVAAITAGLAIALWVVPLAWTRLRAGGGA
jgi:hypothetical protein